MLGPGEAQPCPVPAQQAPEFPRPHPRPTHRPAWAWARAREEPFQPVLPKHCGGLLVLLHGDGALSGTGVRECLCQAPAGAVPGTRQEAGRSPGLAWPVPPAGNRRAAGPPHTSLPRARRMGAHEPRPARSPATPSTPVQAPSVSLPLSLKMFPSQEHALSSTAD